MTKFFYSILLLSNFLFVNKINSQNNESSIDFNAGFISDFVFDGTQKFNQNLVYLGNIDLTLSLDTERLNFWKGGEFFVYLLDNFHKSSTDFVGDFQGVSNIEAEANLRLFQFWYKHSFKKFSFLLGQHDMNSDFTNSETGGEFINSSFGIQPVISSNVSTSIFPVATLGIVLNYNFSEKWSFRNGFYKGNPGSEEENPNSLNLQFNKNEGIMTIHELEYKKSYSKSVNGIFKLGFWNHSGNVEYENIEYKNSCGYYFIGDLIISKNVDKSFGAFVQMGFAPSKANIVKSNLGMGFVYKGIFNLKGKDSMGVSFNHVAFSNTYRNYSPNDLLENETVFELFYDFKFSSNISLQPDIQYVVNPSGLVSNSNSVVGILRLKLEI